MKHHARKRFLIKVVSTVLKKRGKLENSDFTLSLKSMNSIHFVYMLMYINPEVLTNHLPKLRLKT